MEKPIKFQRGRCSGRTAGCTAFITALILAGITVGAVFLYLHLTQDDDPKQYTVTRTIREAWGTDHSDETSTTYTDLQNKLKAALKDVMQPEYDDFYLNNWLKASNYDVKKAEQKFRESLKYKETIQADKILASYKPPEVTEKYFAGGFSGFDKEGAPIRIELFGKLDIKGLMYSSKRTDLEKTRIQQCEAVVQQCAQQSKKLGKRVHGRTVIFDMSGVGMDTLWQPGLKMYLHLVKVVEDNYPGTVKRMFVINAPSIFPILYKLCRPMLSDSTKNKIMVLGSDYMSTMTKYVDADQIPKFLGGTRTDPDGNEKCLETIVHGGKVPESYYLKERDHTVEMVTKTVPKREKVYIPVKVEKPGTMLRWEYTSEGYDIGFAVLFTKPDGTKVEVVPDTRTNSHIMTEDGSVILDKSGEYAVCFDNSFSWTRDKTVKYHIETTFVTNDMDDVLKEEFCEIIEPKAWKTLSEIFKSGPVKCSP